MTAIRSIAVALVALLPVALSGCATTRGHDFRMEDARRVEIGMTKSQVVEIMGCEPSDFHEDASGELWMWNRVVVTMASNQSKSFAVKFEGDKAVQIVR